MTWCAKECRFQALGTVAKTTRVFEKSSVQGLVDMQKTIRYLKETTDIDIMTRPIHAAEVAFRHVADGWITP